MLYLKWWHQEYRSCLKGSSVSQTDAVCAFPVCVKNQTLWLTFLETYVYDNLVLCLKTVKKLVFSTL